MANYLVTLIGTGQSRQVQADDPQTAIETALGSRMGITYLDKNSAHMANARVELVGGKKASVNYYFVREQRATGKLPEDTKMQTRQSLSELFKAEAKKEKDRQVYAGERWSDEDIDKIASSSGLKTAVNKARKEGKTTAEVGKELARARYKKNSMDFDEMIMQTESIGTNYQLVDVNNPQAVISAISTYPCMVLARKQGGGVTGYYCTGNFSVLANIYKGKMFYPLLQLTELYSDFLKITERKVQDIVQGRKYERGTTGKTEFRVASCAIRLKEDKKYDRATKLYVPTGKMKVSSLEYAFILENLLVLAVMKDAKPAANNVIEIVKNLEADAPRTLIEDKIGFNYTAYELAKLAVVALYNDPSEENLTRLYQETGKAIFQAGQDAGISRDDIQLYADTKMEKLGKDASYILKRMKNDTALIVVSKAEA